MNLSEATAAIFLGVFCIVTLVADMRLAFGWFRNKRKAVDDAE